MDIKAISSKFPTEEVCIEYLERIRWNGIPICPYCSSSKISIVKEENRYHCNNCNTSFSVTVGTIFHDTRLPLQKWFLAISLILNEKINISSRKLARELKVNKNTGYYLAMRIRKAMTQKDQRKLLVGILEMDDTYLVRQSSEKR